MKIEEIVRDVYNARYETDRELAKTFVRISGYAENPEFHGRTFTLDEFKEWYIANSKGGKKTGKFTYYDDWEGFNVPSHILTPFYEGRFDPLSERESELLGALEDKQDSKFYLIGTSEKTNSATMKHETSHGLFYTSPEYREKVLNIVRQIPQEEREKMIKFFEELADYMPDVYDDEIHAYLLDRRCIGRNGVKGEILASAGKDIKKVYKKYFDLLKVK